MQEKKKKKKRFLESLGIDINNLPPEFEKHSDSIEESLSQEEIEFLGSERLTGRYNKTFCLKDLVGTTHPDYADKTWIEAFLLSKRGDNAVEQYEKICKIIFESVENDNIKEKCKEMLEDFKATIKDEIGFLNYIYYRQDFKMGANVVKDCLINND